MSDGLCCILSDANVSSCPTLPFLSEPAQAAPLSIAYTDEHDAKVRKRAQKDIVTQDTDSLSSPTPFNCINFFIAGSHISHQACPPMQFALPLGASA
jgi:hypothetical protein